MALIQCPECGNKISDKVRTCPFCNTLINPASAPAAPTPAPTPAPAPTSAPAAAPAPAPTPVAPAPAPAPATTPAPAPDPATIPAPAPVAPPVAPYPYPQQRSSSTGKWIVLGVVIALVVILLGIFIALLALNYLKVASGSPVVVTEEMVAPQAPAPAPVMPHASGSVPGIYPEGSTRYLDYSDVAGKSKWELRIMRNEIYARHNYVFKSPDLIQYFNRQPWYTGLYPDAAYVYTMFSRMEIKNIELIKAYE